MTTTATRHPRGLGHAALLTTLITLSLASCAKQNARAATTRHDTGNQTVAIDLVDYAFRPQRVQATPGVPLAIQLRNKGFTADTFTIHDSNITVDVVLRPGQARTITVTPLPGPVSLRYLCRYHDPSGMHGQLTFGPVAPDLRE